MFASLATKSTLAGLAMIGALVLAPQQASAGRFGGFHGGGFHGGGFHVASPDFAIARPAFHPVFRPAVRVFRPAVHVFRPAFHPAMHFTPRHTMIGGYRPAHFGGAGRHERGEHVGRERGHERTRLGRLEHERGRHGRGGLGSAFSQPDYSEPDAAGPTDVAPPTVYPVTGAGIGPVAGPAASGGAPIGNKAPVAATPPTCRPGTGTGTAVEVIFAPKATAGDVSNFLKAYSVTIVDGPSKDNRYRVRLSDKSLPPNEVMQAVQSMQSQTAIVSTVSVF